MLVDITAIYMGDPITAYRRPPTIEEIQWFDRQRPGARSKGRAPKDKRLLTLEVGDTLTGLTEYQANTARGWMWRNLMACSVSKMRNGLYRLRRVG